MKKNYYLLLLLLFLAKGITGYAFINTKSGSWSDPTIWSTGQVPLSGNNVTIIAGTTVTGTLSNAYVLDIFGTLSLTGDYTNNSGGLTIENGGTMIVSGNMITSSGFVINGNGQFKVIGNLTQSGGTITLNNSAILVVGQSFTEGWQTTNLYNNAKILVVQDYFVNGNANLNGSSSAVVLGTVSGGGLPVYNNAIPTPDPAWNFWSGGVNNYWTGSADSNWSNTANWSQGVLPVSGGNVDFNSTVSNDLILDTDRKVGYLTVTANHRFSVPAGKCLTVNGTITTTGDPNQIYIQSSSSGASGSLIFHNAYGSPVQATVEMYSLASWNKTNPVGGKYKWQFFGIPVRSMASTSPCFDGAFVREMHENDNPVHWFQLNNASGLTSFHGYEITQAAGNTYVFQGALENSDYLVTEPYTTGVSFPGETLIGNSYTAAIDIKKIVFGSQMLATVYLYNTGTYNDWYSIYHGTPDSSKILSGQYTAVPFAHAGDAGIPHQIPSMQAFLVRAKSASSYATVSIPYSSTATVIKNTDMQRSQSVNSDSLPVWTRIDVSGTHFSDRMWIFTDTACTHSFDNGYDGEKFIGSPIEPQIFAMETDGIYQVNSVDDMNNTYLGFQAGEDSLYTMTFTHQNADLKYGRVYLVDSVARITTDITPTGSIYTFTSLPTDTIVKRFKIVTNAGVVTKLNSNETSNTALNVFTSQQTIFVDNKSDIPGTLQMVDLAGRTLQKFTFTANSVTAFPTGLSQGSYIAVAITIKDRITTKLILR